jgi:nucleotide-binding universal stress UspA family protein
MIQKILYPTDLTVHAKDGMAYAFSLARRNRAQLIVFHAISFPSIWLYPCEVEGYCDQWERRLSAFRVDRLLQEGERKVRGFVSGALRAASGEVGWKPRVSLGKAAEEIVAAALQEEANLILMNRRARSRLARVFTLGILEKVTRNAPCPVLLFDGSRTIDRSGSWRLPVVYEVPSY